jgi:hypothetical protein
MIPKRENGLVSITSGVKVPGSPGGCSLHEALAQDAVILGETTSPGTPDSPRKRFPEEEKTSILGRKPVAPQSPGHNHDRRDKQ